MVSFSEGLDGCVKQLGLNVDVAVLFSVTGVRALTGNAVIRIVCAEVSVVV